MNQRKFFAWVWRFNALVIAGAAMVVILVGAYLFLQIALHETRTVQKRSVASAPAATRAPETLRLGRFSWLVQGRSMWAPIQSSQSYGLRIGSKRTVSTRNRIIYDVASGTQRALLPDNKSVIFSARALRYGPGRGAEKPLMAILLVFADKDTSNDGFISYSDQKVIALTRPDGTGLKRLDVKGSPGVVEMLGPDSLLLQISGDGGATGMIYVSL